MDFQIILLGAPGAGKGTLAAPLVDKYGYKHVSTGDLLRKEIKSGSELGNKISGIINDGQLVDDQTVLELLQANCDVENSAYIFDGFPRTAAQAEMLDAQVLKGKKSYAIYFDISQDIIVKRLANRRSCTGCGAIYNLLTLKPQSEGVCDKCGASLFQRDDDREETIRKRLDVYNSTVSEILEYYKAKDRLVNLDANCEASETLSRFEAQVNNL